MKYEISIDCDNAAFGESEDDLKAEITRILQHVLKFGFNLTEGNKLYDANGNAVGAAGLDCFSDLDEWLAERNPDDEDEDEDEDDDQD